MKSTAALVLMDQQRGVLQNYPPGVVQAVLERAHAARQAAREHAIPVVYVRLAFRPKMAEISPDNLLFAKLASVPEFVEGHPGAQIHPDIAPQPGDVVVTKKRASAFTGSDLAQIISAAGVRHLILAGVSTSGVVLSTVREGADRDLMLTVLADACADRDQEVHDLLCRKVLPMQATVSTVDEWITSLPTTQTV